MSADPKQRRDIVVRMPASLHEAIKAMAAENDRSMAQEMRWALRQWVGLSPSPQLGQVP